MSVPRRSSIRSFSSRVDILGQTYRYTLVECQGECGNPKAGRLGPGQTAGAAFFKGDVSVANRRQRKAPRECVTRSNRT
jgi:hypothetical protein